MAEIDFHGAVIPMDLIAGGYVKSRYEPEEVEQALTLFSPGDRVVVAGAGMGWLAAVIAARVGPDNVICVEPISYLAKLVEKNVAVDGVPLRCLWGALTPDGCPATLSFNKDNWALSRSRFEPGRIPGYRLIDMIGAGYTCLALDVEGAEEELLDVKTISGIRKLLLEVHTFVLGNDFAASLRTRLCRSGLQLSETWVRKTTNGDVEIQSWARGGE